ncbi:Sarcosine oxidase [Haloterrigena turkmenica DSM 5511]|uniref:Sarcosine oxidase n=1 Tax=Haloterrigena turkmenica (strain ATCC 51198 / DSM 5511 / JCM 9101 / NCIMB 13204 / VKM B-1734 / 4k) TaxID=543526 RepID=D2RSV1_HALTV|nr:N-methyl-L-tryptophan oxidase [Haloterrigena turkmenica]ADB58925.1 Sarcosine oxidase [Haloterrigena turkmenica DSM 5511]
MVATGTRYDVIVIGVGGMGSATAAHLADRGSDVLGLERYDVPNTMGSSHGITRIIRRAYYEHPSYIPLVERAYELWDDLADETGRDVIHRTGSIDAGPPDNIVFEGSLRSCEEHDIPHEVLTSAEVAERFPGYDLPEGYKALYQPDGGFVVPEQAIVGHVETAQAAGAEVRARERVLEWESTSDEGVRVETDRGTYEAENMVLAAGAWNYKFADVLEDLAVPERQVLGWFQPDRPSTFEPENFPVWNLKVPEGRFYGLPIYDVPGFKIGKYHHRDKQVDPDDYEREPNREDERLLREVTENYFADAAGTTMRLATCMFTNSPDEHFILDTLPEHPQVAVGAGFSGHGFKFASVIGEILADLAIDGDTDHPVDMFRFDRFDV